MVKDYVFILVSIIVFIFKSLGSFSFICHPWPEAIVELMIGIPDESRRRMALQKERRMKPYL